MEKCNDNKCPIHGNVSLRGFSFNGVVVSDKMHHTVTIQIERKHFVKKFNRYEKRLSRIKAHNSECVDAKEGDIVQIYETRPLSKTKNFVVNKIIERKKE